MGYYLTITEEMIKRGLNGSELLVYALINGYSQRSSGCYYGSLENTAEMCGLSRATALRTLQSLTEKGYLLKGRSTINGEIRTTYVATRVSKCNSEQYQNDTAGSVKMIPNNKSINENDNRDIKGFVPPTIEEVRAFCSSRGNSIDAEEFVAHYTSNGWMVGKAKMKDWKSAVITWEKSRKREQSSRPAPQRKKSVLENNIEVFDALFGTNEHARIFGQREDYDEQ